MKYHDQLHLIDYFGVQLSAYLQQQNTTKPKLLIPIPLHSKKCRHRGYNQSAELAKTLSNQLNIPLDNHSLIRTKNTLPQIQLPYNKRKQNMNSAFQCRHNALPEHIALIDDVLTTGHTADMAAKECLTHGAKPVELWTIARTIREYE
jgi:ComF family protein